MGIIPDPLTQNPNIKKIQEFHACIKVEKAIYLDSYFLPFPSDGRNFTCCYYPDHQLRLCSRRRLRGKDEAGICQRTESAEHKPAVVGVSHPARSVRTEHLLSPCEAWRHHCTGLQKHGNTWSKTESPSILVRLKHLSVHRHGND